MRICTISEIPMLHPRRKELLMSLFYSKIKKNPPNRTRMRTRGDHKKNLHLPFPHMSKFKKSPEYRGIQLWNNLLLKIQSATSKENFKKKTKVWYDTDMTGKKAKLLAERGRRRRRH